MKSAPDYRETVLLGARAVLAIIEAPLLFPFWLIGKIAHRCGLLAWFDRLGGGAE